MNALQLGRLAQASSALSACHSEVASHIRPSVIQPRTLLGYIPQVLTASRALSAELLGVQARCAVASCNAG